MNKYIEIIKLLERIFGKSAVSKSIGTRTNVTRFPKGPQGLDPTTRHFDVEATAQKTPELVDTIKNSVGDRMGDLTKMNDQEFLTYKQNVQRLADHVDPPSADIIAAGSKQRVTGKGIEALKQTAGQTNRPGTTIGDIESRINKLKQLGQEMEKTTGEKATLTDVLKDFGTSQSSLSKMQDLGLVRATAREILINDIKAGKIKNITVSEAINMKEPIDPFRQIYGEGALEQLDSLIPNLRNLKTEAEAEKLARSKFKFEPDETRLPGSVSIEEGKKAEQEFGINKPQQTEITNITAKVNKNRDPDILIEEYNKNNQRLSLTDEEGGTLIGYQEFQKLQSRNKEIESILDSFGIKSAEEIKPEGIVIPFRKKITEPENKADGGSIGLDYLMGMDSRQKYAGGGDVKKILDLIAKANKELKGKKSMEGVNLKTGEVTSPKQSIMTADDLKVKHKDAFNAHDQIRVDIGDKIAPDMIAESMAEMKGKEYFSLSQKEQSNLYKKALAYVDDVRMTKRQNKMSIVNEMNQAVEEGVQKTNRMIELGLNPSSSKDYDKFLEMEAIQQKYGNMIDNDLLQKIMVDDNPMRKAEVLGTIDEAMKMQEKGMSPQEIMDIMKNTTRTKQADGGSIGLNYLLGL